jgi:ABC-2 type transport system permease protein
MRGALVIAGKDLRGMFGSPLFYILAGICTLAWSVIFFFTVGEFMSQTLFSRMQGGESGLNLHYNVVLNHLRLVNLVMILASAALTMRLFAEEKRNRTFDLLLTSPVTATEITIGKLIAGVLTGWALVGLSLLYPLSLALFGGLDWGPLASSYIGMLLIVASYISIGMFCSSLTQSGVLAVLMALIFNIMLWFMGAAADSAENPITKKIFEHMSVGLHYENFLKGGVSISGFAFFLSLIFLFAFLTQRVVESARWR